MTARHPDAITMDSIRPAILAGRGLVHQASTDAGLADLWDSLPERERQRCLALIGQDATEAPETTTDDPPAET